jgi:tRNA U34 2-thiouridine synthase MnmA/TrmU
MFQIAGQMMQDQKFDFLFSGEVLGQRPMSQTRSSLRYVEKHSGFAGHILRPLSAKNLPETLPEAKGLVNRELLLDIAGRSRKRQIRLAQDFGITEYPAPAGGCLLTDKGYSAKLKDLFTHKTGMEIRDLHLLKFGRHLRLDEKTKIIIGRMEKENEVLLNYYEPKKDICIRTKRIPGPVVLIPYGASPEKVLLSASLCAGYTKVSAEKKVEIWVAAPWGEKILHAEKKPVNYARFFMI